MTNKAKPPVSKDKKEDLAILLDKRIRFETRKEMKDRINEDIQKMRRAALNRLASKL
jgi:hypothetical protein